MPTLLADDTFYSVIGQRVAQYLIRVGSPTGGPTIQYIVLFYTTFAAWISCYYWLLSSSSVLSAICFGLSVKYFGTFGHSWVHQPCYKFWAYLLLDTIGFSSNGWFREHNLQHHVYTNTPSDNHYVGTAPWLVTDPTVEKNVLQRYAIPYAIRIKTMAVMSMVVL